MAWAMATRTGQPWVRIKGGRGNASRIENRLPTAVAHPYLIVAGVVSAVVDGLHNRDRATAADSVRLDRLRSRQWATAYLRLNPC